MDTGVIKYSIWENVDLTYFFMFFSHYSETICFREYSTSAAAFNTANHWPLPLKDFLGNGKEYEWEGERGRRREEKKADVTDFLTRGKNRNIMLWFFFLRWGQNPRIPPDPQMVSIMTHKASFHQELLTKTDSSWFSCRGEPTNYWRRCFSKRKKKSLAEYKEDGLQLRWKVKLTERVQLKGRRLFWR